MTDKRSPIEAVGSDEYADLVAIASRLFGVSIAAIPLLGHGGSIRIQGMADPAGDLDSCPPCRLIIGSKQPIEIEDIQADSRFESGTVLGRTGIRFLAGAPLLAPCGEVIGALLIADPRSRKLSHEDRQVLLALARQIARSIRGRQLSDAEEQAQTLARLAALGEMAGGVAHEINNPLAIIAGRIAQLRRQAEMREITPEKALELTERIEAHVTRITRIIRGLRAVSRDGSNDPVEPVSLGTLLDNTLALCRARFSYHDVALKVPAEDERKLLIQGRAVELCQALLNLLNNAFDAVRERDEKWVRIEARSHEGLIEVQVIDSGTGIAPELRARIFDPFFSTKSAGLGAGLGLSISRRIAASHGGSLSLDEAHAFTSFVLRIPAA